jgi:hypothetical protein
VQKLLPHAWIDSSVVTAKVAKADDVLAPTQLWDARSLLVLPHLDQALSLLHRILMQRTAHALLTEFCVFMSKHYGSNWAAALTVLCFQKLHDHVPLHRKCTRGVEEDLAKYLNGELLRDAEAGCDAIQRFIDADWWNWRMGSTLFFWHWPEGDARRFARDRMEVYISGKLPLNQKPSRPPPPENEK